MSNLQIKGIDEYLYTQIKALAVREHRMRLWLKYVGQERTQKHL